MDGVQLGAEPDEPAGAGGTDADPDAGRAADGYSWIAGELDYRHTLPLPHYIAQSLHFGYFRSVLSVQTVPLIPNFRVPA